MTAPTTKPGELSLATLKATPFASERDKAAVLADLRALLARCAELEAERDALLAEVAGLRGFIGARAWPALDHGAALLDGEHAEYLAQVAMEGRAVLTKGGAK